MLVSAPDRLPRISVSKVLQCRSDAMHSMRCIYIYLYNGAALVRGLRRNRARSLAIALGRRASARTAPSTNDAEQRLLCVQYSVGLALGERRSVSAISLIFNPYPLSLSLSLPACQFWDDLFVPDAVSCRGEKSVSSDAKGAKTPDAASCLIGDSWTAERERETLILDGRELVRWRFFRRHIDPLQLYMASACLTNSRPIRHLLYESLTEHGFFYLRRVLSGRIYLFFYQMAFGTRKFIASSTQAFHEAISCTDFIHNVYPYNNWCNSLRSYFRILQNGFPAL